MYPDNQIMKQEAGQLNQSRMHNPNLSERLEAEKLGLEKRLKDVDDMLEKLKKNPELLDVLNSL